MAYDFSKLTEAQQGILSFQGWEPGSKFVSQPSPQTMRKLIERGLAVPRKVAFMGITVTAYDVPTLVHMAWCEHCSLQEHGPT